MRRPMVVIAAAVLSGTLYGLPGIPFVYKTVPLIFTAVSVFLLIIKCRGKQRMPLFFFVALLFLLFLAGFLRASKETDRFGQYAVFYAKYEATNPGEFDYAEYLKSVNVTTEEERKALKTRNRDLESKFEKCVGDFREECGNILEQNLSDEDAGILKAMLLGNKQAMTDDAKSLYQKSGIAHLLAVSGLHVSMIGSGISLVLTKGLNAGRKSVGIGSTITVFLYALFTGSSVSSLRAAIMFAIGSVSVFWGRRKDLACSLGTAAVCLILYRPYALKQSGFQLSFLAICGILYAGWISAEWKKAKAMAYCIGVTLFTMPVVAFSYYKVPLYSVLLNLAVIPLMTVVFLSGVLVLFSGAVFPGAVSVIAGIPAHMILKLYSALSEFSLRLPLSQVLVGKPGHFRIILYYTVIILCGLIIHAAKNRREGAIFLFVTYLAVFPLLAVRSQEGTYITVLDVGQGDCFHIHDGATDILIDCGSSGYERAGSQILEKYLLSKKIDKLDLIIVSHADSDHTNGIEYLYSDESSIKIEELCLPYLAGVDDKYDKLKQASGTSFVCCKEGDAFSTDTIRLECIYSEENTDAIRDTNRESAVWLLSAGEFDMLFTGDITEAEERRITEKRTLKEKDIEILKCAHHGSDTANSLRFLKEADPDYAVLSYGKNNRYGHPAETVIRQLESERIGILTTEKYGAIMFRIIKKGYEIDFYGRND